MKKTLKSILTFILALAIVLPFISTAEASAPDTKIKDGDEDYIVSA